MPIEFEHTYPRAILSGACNPGHTGLPFALLPQGSGETQRIPSVAPSCNILLLDTLFYYAPRCGSTRHLLSFPNAFLSARSGAAFGGGHVLPLHAQRAGKTQHLLHNKNYPM